MIIFEWKPFSTDAETYSQSVFEELIGDKFEAMMFHENDPLPSYIWTVNYLIIVKQCSKILSDITFEKLPRNPVSA
ncbi:hypothetical protein [Robertmurraya sp. Marseille-Q9965]